MTFKSKDEFLGELKTLKARFADMQPELEITLRDPAQNVEGFVVVWNTAICKGGPFDRGDGRGAGKGGTRILPNLKLEDIKRLARSMAEKNAAAGLPLGGAKSGLVGDHNAPDYEAKYRRFAKKVRESGILFEDGGIFGGFGYDVGCKPPLNAIWACEEMGTRGSFTGKPVDMGGTDYDREGIAGLGVATAAKVMLEHGGKTAKGATFSVQGAGAMGAAVIRYFTEYGGTLSALSDPKYGGTWTFAKAPSPALLDALTQQNVDAAKTLLTAEAKNISKDNQDALYQDVTVLFPCAMEDVLTKDNAAKVKAPYISEGANNPTTEDAHEILFSAGKTVIPDIIANPGGIIAAFVELTSKVSAEENAKTRAKVIEAKEMTVNRITRNVKEMLDLQTNIKVRGDQIGDYMAYRNIFYGIPS
jgi:glutamate dehydrogenase (NAD(P)+)